MLHGCLNVCPTQLFAFASWKQTIFFTYVCLRVGGLSIADAICEILPARYGGESDGGAEPANATL